MRANHGICWSCLIRKAVTIHHIIPRSLAPDLVDDEENQMPVCNSCHEIATEKGMDYATVMFGRRLRAKKILDKSEAV